MITDHLAELVRSALAEVGIDAEPEFERPRKREHGDWATNVALAAAKGKGNPRDVAQRLVDALPPSEMVDSVEIAGPGFLNFRLSPLWLHDVVRRAADPDDAFGRSDHGAGLKVNVEYVSSNPTGPINVVSGRHAAVGDVVSNLLEATGHEVTREFYVNDAGRQMRLFAESLAARYLQHFGKDATVPAEGYQGDYMTDLAQRVAQDVGSDLLDVPNEERVERIKGIGLGLMLAEMKRSLENFGTHHDRWSLESSLHDSGTIDEALDKLKRAGLLEERESALWFLSSRFGDDKDRVVVKASGEPTYLYGDLGYLLDKFSRGYDRLIYVWGADHHGTMARLFAGVEALGFDRSAVEIEIVQMVNLSVGGEILKGSKRAGRIIELDDLVREVGVDAARYTFLTRSMDAHLDFDIEAVKREAPENPVYYVQYAHARICSILRKAASEGHEPDVANAPLERIEHPSEDELARKLAAYEEVIPGAAELRAPQRVTRYVEELASDFSAFYRDCRVVSDDPGLTQARLALCVATKRVIADALGLLGVGAPERM